MTSEQLNVKPMTHLFLERSYPSARDAVSIIQAFLTEKLSLNAKDSLVIHYIVHYNSLKWDEYIKKELYMNTRKVIERAS